MDSIDSNDDIELMAALIDGRLSGADKARAMKLLADSDEALELFASTVRHQQETSDVKVVPITTARRWRQWKTIVPLAAAAVLTIVVVPKLVNHGAQADSAKAYAMELGQDPRFASGLQSGWDQRWAATRGGGPLREAPGTAPTGTPMESRLAFRLGVRSVDLQIALQRGDTALASRVTTEVVETLTGVAFSDLVGASYTELKSRLAMDTRAQSIDRASRAEHELRDLLGSSLVGVFAFGEWTGAAELAAQTHEASFFQSSHGASSIRSSSSAGSLVPEDVDALKTIDARAKQGLTAGALDEVHDVLQSIIRRRGG